MSKLLESPRIPKEIIAPIKKRRVKKTIEPVEVKYTLLSEGNNGKVQALFALYKKDPYKARVKCFSNEGDFNYRRLVIFEKGDNDFEITEFENKFGISVTNRIYSSQKKLRSIIYKKGKFYYLDNVRKKIRPLTMAAIITFVNDTEHHYYELGSYPHSKFKEKSKTYSFLVEKFKWIQTVYETEAARGISFNSIVSKELYGQKDLLRYVFKVPVNIVNIVLNKPKLSIDDQRFFKIKISNRNADTFEVLKRWKEVSKVLDGVQNLTEEFYHHHLFYDTCSMAHKLGKKVNCRWGLAKLKEMHDDWAKDIRNILLDCELEYKLKIQQGYFGFADYSGFKLLFTNKEMLVEGVRQNHCVGGYIDRVQRGECAIYHVDGFTLQVNVDKAVGTNKGWVMTSEGVLKNYSDISDTLLLQEFKDKFGEDEEPTSMYRLTRVQFRGLRNSDPPAELVAHVDKLLSEYSLTDDFQDLMTNKKKIDEAIISEILKTRWEVIINHITGKYEIKENVELAIPTREELTEMKREMERKTNKEITTEIFPF